MRIWGARGSVSPEQIKKTKRHLAKCRGDQNIKRRAQIAALSNKDIQIIMADVIVDAITARGHVAAHDFANAGLPAHRLEANKAAAIAKAEAAQ